MKWFVDAEGIGALVPAAGGGFERIYLLRQFSGGEAPSTGQQSSNERRAREAVAGDAVDVAGRASSVAPGPITAARLTPRHPGRTSVGSATLPSPRGGQAAR